MSNRGLLLCIFCLLHCLSCKQGCPRAEQDINRADINRAFEDWQEALNYMDIDVIEEAYGVLSQKMSNAHPCVMIDSTVWASLDSISAMYSASLPESELIERAEAITAQLKKELAFQ